MEVKIIDYDHLGRGIGRYEGKIIFIPKTFKDEVVKFKIVKEKKNFIIGKRCDKVTTSYCKYYDICGACQIGHLDYDQQLNLKKNVFINIFKRYTNYNFTDVEIIKTKLYNYRNKVTYHIKEDKLGYYIDKTNELIEINKCMLLDEKIILLTSFLISFIKVNKGLTKAIIKVMDNNIMLILFGNTKEDIVLDFFKDKVSSLYYNNKFLSGELSLITTIFNKKFMVRENSFFQVNKVGISLIYEEVINIVKKLNSNILYDLYSGTGTISILVSDYVKEVKSLEIVEDAYLDALENKKLNNSNNVNFYLGDVSLKIKELDKKPDTIILDPPRSGVSKSLISTIKELKPKNIIYVSCNPITLARDVNLLDDNYFIKEVKLIDEFPNTYHVECVMLLNLK